MAPGPVGIALICKHCGIKVPLPDHATVETVIACPQCGRIAGTYADVARGAAEFGQTALEKAAAPAPEEPSSGNGSDKMN